MSVCQGELEQALQESQFKEQQLDLSNSSLQRQLEQISEEKQEREKEAVSWFNALEVSSLAVTPSGLFFMMEAYVQLKHSFKY